MRVYLIPFTVLLKDYTMTFWLESLKTNLINLHDPSLQADYPQCDENLYLTYPVYRVCLAENSLPLSRNH